LLYLTGAGSAHKTRAAVASAGGRLGYIITPRAGYRMNTIADYPFWAADNGCYSQGEAFQLSVYLAWLGKLQPLAHKCLFAVAPDVLGNAMATWERSAPVLPTLRRLGYKAALVAQDGIEDLCLDWEAFDVLFMGGTTKYKLSETAYAVIREAKLMGKWCHMGRVNSRRRLVAAAVSGYDSADGTHIAFGPDKRLPQLLRWFAELQQQGRFVV
jgi:hypothetical protein